jgi:hypothetical protein
MMGTKASGTDCERRDGSKEKITDELASGRRLRDLRTYGNFQNSFSVLQHLLE